MALFPEDGAPPPADDEVAADDEVVRVRLDALWPAKPPPRITADAAKSVRPSRPLVVPAFET